MWGESEVTGKQKLRETKSAIELAEEELEQARETYHIDTVTSFDQSQHNELARLQSLIVPSMAFPHALQITWVALEQAEEYHDPQKRPYPMQKHQSPSSNLRITVE